MKTYNDPTDSGAFTAEQVAQANARHDRQYGWSMHFQYLYTNPFRLHESIVGKPFEESDKEKAGV